MSFSAPQAGNRPFSEDKRGTERKKPIFGSINITLAADEKFAQHMACAIASVCANARPEEQLTFYLIDGGICEESRAKIESLRSIHPFDFVWLRPDKSEIDGCPDIPQFSMNTYLRLLLPHLLPDVSRLIYLDSDIVVNTSLEQLWNTNLKGKPIGAVRDFLEVNPLIKSQSARLEMTSPYFNAGMLLMDLDLIRREGSFQQTIEWLRNNPKKALFVDQDGLNVVFQSKVHFLSYRWNYIPFPVFPRLCRMIISDRDYRKASRNPGIVHYASPVKPWQSLCRYSERKYYWKYLQMTPWKDFTPPPTKGMENIPILNQLLLLYGIFRLYKWKI